MELRPPLWWLLRCWWLKAPGKDEWLLPSLIHLVLLHQPSAALAGPAGAAYDRAAAGIRHHVAAATPRLSRHSRSSAHSLTPPHPPSPAHPAPLRALPSFMCWTGALVGTLLRSAFIQRLLPPLIPALWAISVGEAHSAGPEWSEKLATQQLPGSWSWVTWPLLDPIFRVPSERLSRPVCGPLIRHPSSARGGPQAGTRQGAAVGLLEELWSRGDLPGQNCLVWYPSPPPEKRLTVRLLVDYKEPPQPETSPP